MKITLSIILLIVFTASCKKDCLKKDKCSPNTYKSSFVVEQTLPSPTANVYYIDAESGKKKNNGKSQNNAFKSIKQLKEITFIPGDQILFKKTLSKIKQ